MRFTLLVKDYQTINLKKLHFRYHAYLSYADHLSRCVADENIEIVSQHLLDNSQYFP